MEDFRPTTLTLPMVIVGILLGSLVCTANMYFGLQIGSINTMSASTALMSFAIFRGLNSWLTHAFTPTENVVVQTIASSIAGMPLAANMLAVLPAFEFLRNPDEGGKRPFSATELILWSLGVSLFGTVFAAPFRTYFLLRERLRFPGGYATGVLLGILHEDNDVAKIADLDKKSLSYLDQGSLNSEENTHRSGSNAEPDFQLANEIRVLFTAFLGTATCVFASYFVPVLKCLPVFGLVAANDWLWFVTLSPAFVAFGMILDLPIAISMTLGAIIGWGILSPLARKNDWAPGPISSMEDGARGWLIWVSIALLFGDAFVRALHAATKLFRGIQRIQSQAARQGDDTREPLLSPVRVSTHSIDNVMLQRGQGRNDNLVSAQVILFWLLSSTGLCVACTWMVFGRDLIFYISLLAVALAFPLCLIVIQSTGETDSAPSNHLSNACQFLFALLLPQASRVTLKTMIAGAITEAGLWQSAVLMTDLKTAYLVRASPKVMFHAQLLGSVIGCFVGSATYRLFTSVHDIPGGEFQIPLAFMWVNTARLAVGGDLPKGVAPFALAAFIGSACLSLIRLLAGNKGWPAKLPSGVAMSIGMYVPPSITLMKLVGASLRMNLIQKHAVSEVTLMAGATGCILGEGTLWFIPMILSALNVPRLL